MTDAGQIPQTVLDRAAARLGAQTRTDLCTRDGCNELAVHGACNKPGRWCPEHWAAFGVRVVVPDPAMDAQALRERALRARKDQT